MCFLLKGCEFKLPELYKRHNLMSLIKEIYIVYCWGFPLNFVKVYEKNATKYIFLHKKVIFLSKLSLKKLLDCIYNRIYAQKAVISRASLRLTYIYVYLSLCIIIMEHLIFKYDFLNENILNGLEITVCSISRYFINVLHRVTK